jgi:hypothetical protein
MTTPIPGSRVAGEDVVRGDDSAIVVSVNTPVMPTMKTMQCVRLQLFEDCNEDIVNYFYKIHTADIEPASGAKFLRNYAQVSKTHQLSVEQYLRQNPALSLAATLHSIPEIVKRTADAGQIKLLVQDLIQRHAHVTLNFVGKSLLPCMDVIMQSALSASPDVHLVMDMSAYASREEKICAPNFPNDGKPFDAFTDAAALLESDLQKLTIDMHLQGRYLQPRIFRRLSKEGMPSIRKLDLSSVKLMYPSIAFKPEYHHFCLPELLASLLALIQRGHLTALTLSRMAMLPSHCAKLAEYLAQGKAFTVLDLSGNSLGAQQKGMEKNSQAGVQALATLLMSAVCPRRLILNGCGIDDAGATLLVAALQAPQKALEALHLQGNPIAAGHPLWLDARVQGAPQNH